MKWWKVRIGKQVHFVVAKSPRAARNFYGGFGAVSRAWIEKEIWK